jgi:hypothetical protein
MRAFMEGTAGAWRVQSWRHPEGCSSTGDGVCGVRRSVDALRAAVESTFACAPGAAVRMGIDVGPAQAGDGFGLTLNRCSG